MTTAQVSRGWWVAAVLACLIVNPYVRGDGNGYYAWLVSPIIDGDLDFSNQFRRADPLFQALVFAEDGTVRPEIITPTGRVGNQWSVGPAVVWAPWFVAAHMAVTIARTLGADVAADGYSWPYLWSVSIGTALYGLLALWWSGRIATWLGYGDTSLIAILGIGLASTLPVYQLFLPFHVHALAACVVAAFVAYGVRYQDMSRVTHWVWWGALAGLMVQVYHLNGVMVVAAVWHWVRTIRSTGWIRAIGRGVAFTLAAIVVCLPQLVGKAIVYGRPWVTGYQDQFFWSDPRLWQTAVSGDHGWITWTPVVALALAGLVWVWRHHPVMRVWIVCAALFYWVLASYQNWHGQSSFGNRFLVSLTVVLVIGLAALAHHLRSWSWWPRQGLPAVLVLLAVWNVGFIFQWGTNIIPNRGAVSFTTVAHNQVTVVPARLAGFVRRYLGDRRSVQDEVERGDQSERSGYTVVR
jgi:hypothetical protein